MILNRTILGILWREAELRFGARLPKPLFDVYHEPDVAVIVSLHLSWFRSGRVYRFSWDPLQSKFVTAWGLCQYGRSTAANQTAYSPKREDVFWYALGIGKDPIVGAAAFGRSSRPHIDTGLSLIDSQYLQNLRNNLYDEEET